MAEVDLFGRDKTDTSVIFLWKGRGTMRVKHSLYSSQLERDVEIHVILPVGYHRSAQQYPVLYFYDGDRIYDCPDVQGVSALHGSFEFADYQDAFGSFIPAVIIVGIAPPQNMWKRTAEYSPYSKQFDVPEGVNFESDIHGKGAELGDWVVHDLKPWIDARYRTLPAAEDTGIGGLSTSGVNALYMMSTYPQIFTRCMVHAPAVHLWMDKIVQTISDAAYSHMKFFYCDIGTDDCTRMVKNGECLQDIVTLLELLKKNHLSEEAIRFFQIYRGTHECETWRLTFPDALRWIFQDIPASAEQ